MMQSENGLAVLQLALNFTTLPITVASNSTRLYNNSSSVGPTRAQQRLKRVIGKHRWRNICSVLALNLCFLVNVFYILICHAAL